jgi:hypothetical protein
LTALKEKAIDNTKKSSALLLCIETAITEKKTREAYAAYTDYRKNYFKENEKLLEELKQSASEARSAARTAVANARATRRIAQRTNRLANLAKRIADSFPIYELDPNKVQSWTKGSADGLNFHVVNDNELSFVEPYYAIQSVYVDGVKITNWSKTPGSVNVLLDKDYLNSLSAGSHSIVINFFRGSVSSSFSIKNKPSSDDKKNTPKVIDNVVTCQMAGYPAGYEWNESVKACMPGFLDANGVFHSTVRVASPNTADPMRNLVTFITSMLTAIAAAFLLKTRG